MIKHGEGSPSRSIKRISFVVPALNEGRNIQDLINSIAVQKRPEGLEINLIISDNESSDEASIEEYQRVLTTPQPISVSVISGARRGYIGAARELGVRAAIGSYNEDHPTDINAHIIIGYDADSPIRSDIALIPSIVASFINHPDAELLYGPIPLSTSSRGPMSWTTPFIRPVFTEAFFRRHFFRNRRWGQINNLLHAPRQMFQGGFEIFTQHAYEQMVEKYKSAFNMQDSAAEGATFSARIQTILNPEQVVYDRRVIVPYSLREIEGKNGRINVSKAIRKALSLLFFGSEHLSHKLTVALEAMSFQERQQFVKQLGNLTFRGAINTFIREEEERIFGVLDAREHIIHYVSKRRARKLKKQGENIREGVSEINGRRLYGQIVRTSSDLDLLPHEYVAFYVTQRQAHSLQRNEYAVIKTFQDIKKGETVHVLIGKKAIQQNITYTFLK